MSMHVTKWSSDLVLFYGGMMTYCEELRLFEPS